MPLRSDFSIDAVTPKDPRAKGHVTSDRIGESPKELLNFRPPVAQNAKKGDTSGIDLESIETTGVSPPRRRVAFLVTHGMGQQVPFETVSMLGQALLTQHGTQNNATSPEQKLHANSNRVRLTKAPDAPELSRVEVTLTAEGGGEVNVHLYESYWAPFTEGQISFLATVKFLYFAALSGIWTAIKSRGRAKNTVTNEMSPEQAGIAGKKSDGMKHFDRWMFGMFRDMPVKKWTFWILVTLVVVLTLALLPSILLFTSFGISALKSLYTHFGPTVTRLSLPWRILGGAAAAAILGIALAVRYAVVEYVGDVAIYVSSYKVSRYNEIRTKILNEVMNVARQIYSAGIADDLQYPYDDVVIVGHSLGSVISYDLLNWCINWDQVENEFLYDVVGRSRRLITFGSPLDKTAFLFRTQVSDARNLREALAARQQPLILDYTKFRPRDTFRWVNIYAPADIISGPLDYYDVEGLEGFNGIVNVKDPEATRPLLAHVQYWNNDELHKQLYDAAWAGVHVHASPRT